MRQYIRFDRVFDGHDLHFNATAEISDGCITDLHLDSNTPHSVSVAGLLSPGFVDLQVNGGGGVLFNNDATKEGIKVITDAHRLFGTTALMPTIITDHPDVMDKAADAAIAAVASSGFIGLHLEGPHISVKRRGTHATEFIRPLDKRTMATIERLVSADVKVKITLAPESVTAEQVAHLVAMQTLVSVGHTDASSEAVGELLVAGADCATHLFNAMSPMTSRAPGAVGAVINSDCYAGIICDGHHVSNEMVGLALRARPVPDRMFLVSDAMATVGGPDQFSLYGQTIKLSGGRLVNSEGNLAGAHLTQAEGVRRLVDHVGVGLRQALKMVTSTPADCVGKPELGQLVGRHVHDAIVLNDDLSVRGTLDGVPETHF